MIVVTPKKLIDAYYSDEIHLNQSSLKNLVKGVESYKKEMQKIEESKNLPSKPHFVFGHAVEDLVMPDKNVPFEDMYYISSSDKKPSDREMTIFNDVFETITTKSDFESVDDIGPLKDYGVEIIEAANRDGWQINWGDKTRFEKLVASGTAYFEDLKNSYGKQILSVEQFEMIKKTADSLKTNPRTKGYFQDKVSKNKDIEFITFYSFPIYFEISGLPCKALLDLLIAEVNTKTNKVISLLPVDLKTTAGYTRDFPSKAKTFRYDIQAAWYVHALTWMIEDEPLLLGKYAFDEDPEIKHFTFIVESSTNPGNPLVYKCTNDFLESGKYGRTNNVIQTLIYPGYTQLFKEFKYQVETGWVEDSDVTANNGVMDLDI